MYKTIATLMLLSVSASAQERQSLKEFTLEPLTKSFSVLGATKGVLVVENNLSCMIAAPVRLSRPQVDKKSVHISSLRFGIAVANGRDDWKILASSKYWPLNVNVSSKEETAVEYAFGCFETPSNLVAGKYWLFMQINFDDAEKHSASTYAATEEYWQLINVPKDIPLTPAPLPQGVTGTSN